MIRKAFTLLEAAATVAVLMILSAIAYAAFNNVVDGSAQDAFRLNTGDVVQAAYAHALGNKRTAITMQDMTLTVAKVPNYTVQGVQKTSTLLVAQITSTDADGIYGCVYPNGVTGSLENLTVQDTPC